MCIPFILHLSDERFVLSVFHYLKNESSGGIGLKYPTMNSSLGNEERVLEPNRKWAELLEWRSVIRGNHQSIL